MRKLMRVDAKINNGIMRIVFFLLLVFNLSCKGQKDINKLNKKPLEVGLELVIEGNYSGIQTSKNLIIKDKETLQKFFSQINKMRKPGIPLPVIDFSKEVVVILCEGEHDASSRNGLEFLMETEKEIVIQTVKHKKTSTSLAIVSPFKIYKLASSKKEIIIK